jgi:ABC-2 type transport system ATP-binding protein
MIEFQQVSRSYGDKLAVDNLNLRVGAGELYSLLGHNGAGKTTAIKMLVGLMRPGQGNIRVCGFDVVSHTRDATAQIGYVPDQPFLYDKLTGRELLLFVARMYGMDMDAANRAMDREIQRFELADFVNDLTETYSHGMKQRTVFASALLHNPTVLVVDEPMVGLDPHSIRLVKDLLQFEVSRGMCVLMSTHTLGAAEEISDRVGIMSQGRLVFDGTISELREQFGADDQSLEALFLSVTARDHDAVKTTDSAVPGSCDRGAARLPSSRAQAEGSATSSDPPTRRELNSSSEARDLKPDRPTAEVRK